MSVRNVTGATKINANGVGLECASPRDLRRAVRLTPKPELPSIPVLSGSVEFAGHDAH